MDFEESSAPIKERPFAACFIHSSNPLDPTLGTRQPCPVQALRRDPPEAAAALVCRAIGHLEQLRPYFILGCGRPAGRYWWDNSSFRDLRNCVPWRRPPGSRYAAF